MNLNSIIKAAKAYPKVYVGQRYEFYEVDESHAAEAISVLADQRARLAGALRIAAVELAVLADRMRDFGKVDIAKAVDRSVASYRAALAELDQE